MTDLKSVLEAPVPWKKLLVGLLLVALLVAVAWFVLWGQDRMVRAEVIQSIDKIKVHFDTIEGEMLPSSGAKPTREEIHEILGRSPDALGSSGPDRVTEVYRWRSLSGEKYEIYIVYKKNQAGRLEMFKAKAYGKIFGTPVGPAHLLDELLPIRPLSSKQTDEKD